jgi:hypothetical protein
MTILYCHYLFLINLIESFMIVSHIKTSVRIEKLSNNYWMKYDNLGNYVVIRLDKEVCACKY